MYRTELYPGDLDFIIGAAAEQTVNKEGLRKAILEDESFRRGITGDEKLFDAVMNRRGILKEVSPSLFFEVLLRRAFREMEGSVYTVERTASQKIPVFDSQDALELMRNDDVFYYLIGLLASFVAAENGTPEQTGINALIRIGKDAEPDKRFVISRT